MPTAETPVTPPPRTDLIDRLRAAGCVFAEDEAQLLDAAAAGVELEALIRRRVAGEPLERILGWAQFRGLRIGVDPGVFVPRARTELLVVEAARRAYPGSAVVDLCCGSGAVGVAVAAAVPGIRLLASDVEPAAVACARRNVEPIGGQVVEGDLFAALPKGLRGRIDVLTVNAPYVPTGEIAGMPREARDWEPRVTLDGGGDGLDVQRRIAESAPAWLAPGGTILIETSGPQAAATAALLTAAGLPSHLLRDEALGATIAVAFRPVGHRSFS